MAATIHASVFLKWYRFLRLQNELRCCLRDLISWSRVMKGQNLTLHFFLAVLNNISKLYVAIESSQFKSLHIHPILFLTLEKRSEPRGTLFTGWLKCLKYLKYLSCDLVSSSLIYSPSHSNSLYVGHNPSHGLLITCINPVKPSNFKAGVAKISQCPH